MPSIDIHLVHVYFNTIEYMEHSIVKNFVNRSKQIKDVTRGSYQGDEARRETFVVV